jgi:DNA-binding NarL/FixJ family response regulator
MIHISVIEDHHDFRNALMQLLQIADGFTPISSFSNAEDAIESLSGKEDIILLDINLPKMSGVDAIPFIKQKYPEVKIIMLTMLDDDNTVMQAILNGANGYLLKKTSPEQILSSLQICQEGGSPMTPGIASKVLQLFKKYIPQKNNDYALTKREIEILSNLVEGLDNQQIADKLFISIQTVRNHIRHIYEKLQVHSKSQAVVKALRESLI